MLLLTHTPLLDLNISFCDVISVSFLERTTIIKLTDVVSESMLLDFYQHFFASQKLPLGSEPKKLKDILIVQIDAHSIP